MKQGTPVAATKLSKLSLGALRAVAYYLPLLNIGLRGIQLDGAFLFITHDEGYPAIGRLRNHRALLARQHRPPISLHAARKPIGESWDVGPKGNGQERSSLAVPRRRASALLLKCRDAENLAQPFRSRTARPARGSGVRPITTRTGMSLMGSVKRFAKQPGRRSSNRKTRGESWPRRIPTTPKCRRSHETGLV